MAEYSLSVSQAVEKQHSSPQQTPFQPPAKEVSSTLASLYPVLGHVKDTIICSPAGVNC